jgi:hypothetical protein
MKSSLIITCFTILFLSCKSEKNDIKTEALSTKVEKIEMSDYENQLIDYRDVDVQFLENYKIKKFGLKKNDFENSYGFVLKLDKSTNESIVKNYSIGVKAYSQDIKKPLSFSLNPIATKIEDESYVVLNKKLPLDLKYFDSLRFIIYERKNWKNSGVLGEFYIKDVLLEN